MSSRDEVSALFGSAGHLEWPMAWAFLVVYVAFTVLAFLVLSPSLIVERSRLSAGAKRSDLVLASLFSILLYPATLITCGLDARFGWSPPVLAAVQSLALGLFVVGYAFAFWAMYANPFFSTFVRIQSERGHHVIDRGPYRFVRHPGYAGASVAHLALPVALGSLWGLVPALCGILLLALRTANEDRTLQRELAGYRDYALCVRRRLIPGIW